MKKYNPSVRWGKHKVKVTFQVDEYKGHVYGHMGGNTKGGHILQNFVSDADWLAYEPENDCNLTYFEDSDWARMTLKDEEGNEVIIEEEVEYLLNYIVAAEIIDFEEDN